MAVLNPNKSLFEDLAKFLGISPDVKARRLILDLQVDCRPMVYIEHFVERDVEQSDMGDEFRKYSLERVPEWSKHNVSLLPADIVERGS
jgi:hypothetical protein